MFQPEKDGIHARLEASPLRRLLALGILIGLGGLLIYLGFVSLGGAVDRLILVALGAAVLFLFEKMRRDTTGALVLTNRGVEDHDGQLLVPIETIQRVERGTFAAKPSNGFTLVTDRKMTRGWVPGIWWCFGKRFGVGGISSAGAAKFMAEQIAQRLNAR